MTSKAKTARSLSTLNGSVVESVGLAPFSQGPVRPRTRFALAALLTAALTLLVIVPNAFGFHSYTSSFGSSGAAESQFGSGSPNGPAVNQSTGDLYVADTANSRIERFQADGTFVSAWGWGVTDGSSAAQVCTSSCQAGISGSGGGQLAAPTFVAVDNSGGASDGDVYVGDTTNDTVSKFDAAGNYISTNDGSTATDGPFGSLAGIAVNSAGDLWVYDQGAEMFRFAQDGTFTTDFNTTYAVTPAGIAVDPTDDLYIVRGSPAVEKFSDTGSDLGQVTPDSSTTGLAIDPASGDLYVAEGATVDIFDSACDPSGGTCAIADSFGSPDITAATGLAVRGSSSRVYVSDAGNTELDIFDPAAPAAPSVISESVANVGFTAATLTAHVNPNFDPTTYHFEYGTAGPCDSNPCTSTPVGSLPGGGSPVAVQAGVSGLTPGTTYHYRVVASNGLGPVDGLDHTFTTFAHPAPQSCPNADLRQANNSNALPDCRAYELVTPRDTNGQSPTTAGDGVGFNQNADHFNSPSATADGDNFLWNLQFTVLPGTPGGGFLNTYQAQRGVSGWTQDFQSPTAVEDGVPDTGGYSADQGYHEFAAPDFSGGRYAGTFDIDPLGEASRWIRYPDGSFHLLGEGTLPASPDNDGNPNGFLDFPPARARWISSGGTHIILDTASNNGERAVPLTADAPPAPTPAVYDRMPSGLHLISLLPGEVTPSTPSSFQGASADGSVVLFANDAELYARIDDASTLHLASGIADGTGNLDQSGGVSDDGGKAFWAKGGNLFRFDTSSLQTDQVNSSADAQFVSISPDGSHVYFTSPSQLDGANGTAGQPNLYVWDGSATKFIATVSDSDSLNNWSTPVDNFPPKNQGASFQNAQPTPDGTAFIFRTSVQLTAYNNAGHAEIYRYRTSDQSLVCVSCNPSSAPATADAALDEPSGVHGGFNTLIANLSSDGDTVFFQTDDDLLPQDGDGITDVYEWHEGQLSLISSGQSSQANILMGATPSASDVYIETADRPIPGGQDAGVPAIYDARVNGGFPVAAGPPACLGDACQGDPTPPPGDQSPGSSSFSGPGNQGKDHGGATTAQPKKKCKKKHKKCKRSRRANTNRGGSK